MIFKDFLTKLKKDGKIAEPEFDGLIEKAPDFDFPDKAVEAFEASFLTIDRAVTDKSVNTRIKREALDGIDRDIHEFVDLDLKDYVNPEKREALKKNANTYEKIKSLSGLVAEALKKNKSVPVTDEDTKKKLKTLEEAKQELLDRIEKMNSEYEGKEKALQTDYQKKISDFQLNIELEKLANSFKFGKAFEDESIRKDITKVKLDKLRASNALQLVEKDGQTVIQVNDGEGKPRFNGNSAITINQLLEEEFKPYIKASNAGDDEDEPDHQETKRFRIPDGKQTIRQGARTTVV